MAEPHRSYFSYNLTRPYPFKWFTWVIGIGGVVAIILFSVLNYAANAFTLTTVYTTDPNTTLTQNNWYEKAPFTLSSKYVTTCQPLNIAINSQFFTTHFGLTYTVTNVSTHDGQDDISIQPSITYLNNTLSDCSIDRIQLNAVNSNSLGNGKYYAWETSKYSAFATCQLSNASQAGALSMSVEWMPLTYRTNDRPLGFVQSDKKKQANLWWARQMLWRAYYDVNHALSNTDADQDPTVQNTVSRARIDLVPTNNGSIDNYNFFGLDCRILRGNGRLMTSIGRMSDKPCGLPIGDELDRMSKLLYSTVLADLGESQKPNILASHDSLRKFLNELSEDPLYTVTGTPNSTYDSQDGASDDLTITPATLYGQYMCQVPTRKSVGSMLIAILVADLVLLQALWILFTWITSFALERTDATSNHCAGCVKLLNDHGDRHALHKSEGISSGSTPRSASPSTTSMVNNRKQSPKTAVYEVLPQADTQDFR